MGLGKSKQSKNIKQNVGGGPQQTFHSNQENQQIEHREDQEISMQQSNKDGEISQLQKQSDTNPKSVDEIGKEMVETTNKEELAKNNEDRKPDPESKSLKVVAENEVKESSKGDVHNKKRVENTTDKSSNTEGIVPKEVIAKKLDKSESEVKVENDAINNEDTLDSDTVKEPTLEKEAEKIDVKKLDVSESEIKIENDVLCKKDTTDGITVKNQKLVKETVETDAKKVENDVPNKKDTIDDSIAKTQTLVEEADKIDAKNFDKTETKVEDGDLVKKQTLVKEVEETDESQSTTEREHVAKSIEETVRKSADKVLTKEEETVSNVERRIEEIEPKIHTLVGLRTSNDFFELDEGLIQGCLQLDTLKLDKSSDLHKKKIELLKKINKLNDLLDEKETRNFENQAEEVLSMLDSVSKMVNQLRQNLCEDDEDLNKRRISHIKDIGERVEKLRDSFKSSD